MEIFISEPRWVVSKRHTKMFEIMNRLDIKYLYCICDVFTKTIDEENKLYWCTNYNFTYTRSSRGLYLTWNAYKSDQFRIGHRINRRKLKKLCRHQQTYGSVAIQTNKSLGEQARHIKIDRDVSSTIIRNLEGILTLETLASIG